MTRWCSGCYRHLTARGNEVQIHGSARCLCVCAWSSDMQLCYLVTINTHRCECLSLYVSPVIDVQGKIPLLSGDTWDRLQLCHDSSEVKQSG